ncbi:helix-turn-helix domain-containing protein [Klebsiella oxytoca]|nr:MULTISPECIES: helix-turn-helix domain-containing protein [Klebsiella]UPI88855.1 helix-turn-helix domain-containing protein [Klebsiella michiganensis]WDQ07442.1 helix-turn-helix domain-containing protein [Klebsiella oxytoca]
MAADNYHDSRHLLFPQPDGQHRYQYASRTLFLPRMSALAEMERELIVERTRAGLAAAREQGRIGGRRRIMTTEVVERCRRMLENGATRQQIADVVGVGTKSIYKYLPVGIPTKSKALPQ